MLSAVIELACHSAACAPPPVGVGGSEPGGGGASGGGLTDRQREALRPRDLMAENGGTGAHLDERASKLAHETEGILSETPDGENLAKVMRRWFPGHEIVSLQKGVAKEVGAPPSPYDANYVDPTPPDQVRSVLGILRSMGDAPALYRGIGLDSHSEDEALAKFAPGTTHDFNVSSFSSSSYVASQFGSADGTTVSFKTLPGGHGIPIQNLAGPWHLQYEYLAGGRFEVVKAEVVTFQEYFTRVEVTLRELSTL